MYFVGDRIPVKARKLVDVTYEAMMRGIAAVKPGVHIGDIGHAIQTYAESQRFSVVRDFCGHGVGRVFHDAPDDPALRQARGRAGAARRHVLHRRADDECRPLGGEGPERRLDRGHQGQLALGPVRAHGRRHRDRLRDLHALARRPAPPPYDLSLRQKIPARLIRRKRAVGKVRCAKPVPSAAARPRLLSKKCGV